MKRLEERCKTMQQAGIDLRMELNGTKEELQQVQGTLAMRERELEQAQERAVEQEALLQESEQERASIQEQLVEQVARVAELQAEEEVGVEKVKLGIIPREYTL